MTSATNTAADHRRPVNLSPRSWNATLYYDDGRFSIRGSASYRERLSAARAGAEHQRRRGQELDPQRRRLGLYQLNDIITLTAEAINLTDEFNDQFVDRDRNSPSVVHHTGRQFYAGSATSSDAG